LSAFEVLSKLRALNVTLRVEGGQLRASAPKGVLTPELQREIAEWKAELLAILREAGQGKSAPAPLLPRSPGAQFPLSSAQQRLWFIHRLDPDSPAYNLVLTRRIWMEVDEEILQRTLDELVRRHEILRTTFCMGEEEPVQVVHETGGIALVTQDLRHLPPEERAEAAYCAVREAAKEPFDLEQGPLVRCMLFRLDAAEHILGLVIHHIIFDGWSRGVLDRELSAIYRALREDRPHGLAELPFQYADYAVWQRGRVAELEHQLAYWKKQLAGPVARLELPADHPQRPEGEARAFSKFLLLPDELSRAVFSLAREENVTPFAVLLAAFQLLLYRLSGQEDVILGVPVAGRQHPELENLIGLFLNTLVLRTGLSGNPSFRELLARTSCTLVGAYENQEFPFERLVEELQPERSLHRNPLFDVLVNYIPPDQSYHLGDMPALGDDLDLGEDEARFPLTLYIEHWQNQLRLRLMAQNDLFSEERAAALLDQYVFLLEQAVADRSAPIRSYSLVTPAAASLLPDPRAPLAVPRQELFYRWIVDWARRCPDATALEQDGRRWTYAELVEQAERIARGLVGLGLRPGETAAVTGERSFGLVASLLGVFMAGGVALGLDPLLPERRAREMLKIAGTRWLLACGGWEDPAALLSDLPQARLLRLRPESGALEESAGSAAPLPELSPDAPAYIFFTSGTTRFPRAVLGVHRGLSHFLAWQRETFSVTPNDRTAQFTGLSFDVVLRDLFLPLVSGATLALPPAGVLPGSESGLRWMEQARITLLHTVPSVAQAWLAANTGARLESLRWVFFAGEPLPEALVRSWREQFGRQTGIANLYGPTETTLAKFYALIGEEPWPGVQPVGCPLPQTQGLVLSPEGKLCGVGEPGEIAIRTPFRSLGYLNEPEENAARFFPNPFRDDPADLLYRTGDLGRYRPDGSLEILGRLDEQVKINGVRVDPGEIASLLIEHPEVKSAVVVARKEEGRPPALVAYVVAGQGSRLDSAPLRRHCAERLPGALVPSAFVFLERLPLGPNGKVDRKALPPPETVQPQAGEATLSPRDEIETRLAEIWKKLLRVERVGVQDDFFALSGHSLLAVRLFVRIQEAFGVNLPLNSLFREATIENLARQIRSQSRMEAWSSLVPIRPEGGRPPFFCVHGITGDAVWFEYLVPYLDPDQPIWGLQSRGLDGVQQPCTSIEEMAAHYISEIRALQPTGPYYLGGYSYGGSIAYEMARQLWEANQEVGLLVIIDHATPKSGYYDVRLSPALLWGMLRNFPYHLADFLRLRPDQILRRLARKARVILKRLSASLPRPARQGRGVDAKDLIDEAPHLPAHIQQLIEINFNAILRYDPRPYSGRVTLLRAKGERLVCSHDYYMGWSRFAAGGVDVRLIPGSHLSLFKEPHIRRLAAQLQTCLDETRPGERVGEPRREVGTEICTAD